MYHSSNVLLSGRFGAPSHRLEAQIQATGRVLELPNCHCVYLPGVMLINFGDPATCTSDIKVSDATITYRLETNASLGSKQFLKQPQGLDFGKLRGAFYVYSKVSLSYRRASEKTLLTF